MTVSNTAPIGFEDLGLPASILSAIAPLGFDVPTEIQARTIPLLLEGRDLIGQAQTGTGKTAAFALPLLSRINADSRETQVLVLTPTRELAIQVAGACGEYAAGLSGLSILPIFGGQDYGIQLRGLGRGAQMVVGTPGRVMDHIRKGTLTLGGLQALVLDEADEMLRMGFMEDVEWIMEQLPENRQTALFSATMPPAIRRVAQTYLDNPEQVSLQKGSTAAVTIEQRYCITAPSNKVEVLARIIEGEETDGVIVFARTKADTVTVAEELVKRGLKAAVLNGDLVQAMRERTVDALRKGRLDILVATDVAARGLDVERISHVINYDPPMDAETYVHRIGRTGRAGRAGKAILMLSPRDRQTLRNVSGKTKQQIAPMEIPSAKQLNRSRIARLAADIRAASTADSTQAYRAAVSDIMTGEEGLSAEDVAAALAAMLYRENPLLLKELPEVFSPQTTRGRGVSSVQTKIGRKPQRGGGPVRNDENMERYTVQVGSSHGLNPGHLVGAIANEADLSSRHIGRIEIYGAYSTVDLPAGMPEETYKILSKVKVLNRPLRLRKGGPERAPRPARAAGKPKRPTARRASA